MPKNVISKYSKSTFRKVTVCRNSVEETWYVILVLVGTLVGFECKNFNLGSHQSTLLSTTLKRILNFLIKSGILDKNLGFIGAPNPLKFAAWLVFIIRVKFLLIDYCPF